MREFMVGEVRAVRDFRVGRNGTLISPVRGTYWTPGENVALCNGLPAEEAHPDTPPTCTCGLAEALELLAETRRNRGDTFYADCRHGDSCALVRFSTMSNCACGFYAFHGSSLYRRGFYSTEASAVVEMWGAGELGPRGVRMSRARIVAVALRTPSPRPPRLRRPWIAAAATFALALIVVSILLGVRSDATESSLLAVIPCITLAIGIVVAVFVVTAVAAIGARPPTRYYPDPEKVAARYPDAKIYLDVETMLENHPPTFAADRTEDRVKL